MHKISVAQENMELDYAKYLKYSKPGSRYTSYPGCSVVFTFKEDNVLYYMEYLKREVIQMHFSGRALFSIMQYTIDSLTKMAIK
nr:hypothetical protein [Sulfurimonas sp. SAG-AH-194-C20]